MDNNEALHSIAKGRLPITISDLIQYPYFMVLFLGAIFSITQNILWLFIPLLFVSGYLAWSDLYIGKKLFEYPSTLPTKLKQSVLDKVVADYHPLDVSRTGNCYSVLVHDQLMGSFYCEILFNETGYYINSRKRMGRGVYSYSAGTRHVLSRIKQFENIL